MYKLYKTSYGVDAVMRLNEDGSVTSFLCNTDNTDYAEYLKWLEAGNQPLPPEEN